MRSITTTSVLLLLGLRLVCPTMASEGDEPAWTDTERRNGYVAFTHSTMRWLKSELVPARGAIVDEVSCELAQGERGSVQIGLYASARCKHIAEACLLKHVYPLTILRWVKDLSHTSTFENYADPIRYLHGQHTSAVASSRY